MTPSPAHQAVFLPLDTRLIAAVQARAGARVHESAGLLYAYRLSADCYRLTLTTGDSRAAARARMNYELSEWRLRRFVAARAV